MIFVDSIIQNYNGVGGVLETWFMKNGLYIKLWKNLDGTYNDRDQIYLKDNLGHLYTKSVYDLVCGNIPMEYGGFFPSKIIFDHKYFDMFITIVEKLDLNDLMPDPFEG